MASCQEGHARAARGKARATRSVKNATTNNQRFIVSPFRPSVPCHVFKSQKTSVRSLVGSSLQWP
jgi:hypothetical protein